MREDERVQWARQRAEEWAIINRLEKEARVQANYYAGKIAQHQANIRRLDRQLGEES